MNREEDRKKLEELEKEYYGTVTRLDEINIELERIAANNPLLGSFNIYLDNCTYINIKRKTKRLVRKIITRYPILSSKLISLRQELLELNKKYKEMLKLNYPFEIKRLRKSLCKHIMLKLKEILPYKDGEHLAGPSFMYCPKCHLDNLNPTNKDIFIDTYDSGVVGDIEIESDNVMEYAERLYMQAVDQELIDEDTKLLRSIQSNHMNNIRRNPTLKKSNY